MSCPGLLIKAEYAWFCLDATGEIPIDKIVDTIPPQRNKFAMGVGNKATADSKLNDSPGTCIY